MAGRQADNYQMGWSRAARLQKCTIAESLTDTDYYPKVGLCKVILSAPSAQWNCLSLVNRSHFRVLLCLTERDFVE